MFGSETSSEQLEPLSDVVIPRPTLARQAPNDLLRQLPVHCRENIMTRAERVPLARRQTLMEGNVPLRYAYFIESGAASLFARAGGDRANVEIRTLGTGDFVGIPLVLGADASPHRCIVQVAGQALRLSADHLVSAMEDVPELRRALLRYVHGALIHSSQLVACNTTHSLRQRLARWLLVASDRLNSQDVALTHEVIGRAIAVRRAGITTEIGRMEEAGLIRRQRGCVSILDRPGLESASCNCYRILQTLPNVRHIESGMGPADTTPDRLQSGRFLATEVGLAPN